MPPHKSVIIGTDRGGASDSEDTYYLKILPNACRQFLQPMTSRQAVRLLSFIAACIVSVFFVYQWTGVEQKGGVVAVDVPESSSSPKQSSSVPVKIAPGPQNGDITQLGVLDTAFIPGNSHDTTPGPDKRLVFIGDIHGCYAELMELLSKADYNEATDHIIATGDMVNKGPSSGAVIDFLISHGASCVRGNHDNKILLKHVMEEPADIPGVAQDPELVLARSLTPTQIAYLESCPLVLRIGAIPAHGNILVVHAGLVPSLELAEQDSNLVMNMRTIDPLTHTASPQYEKEGYIPWADFWNQEQVQGHESARPSQFANRHLGTTVIYGHDAKRGLRIQKYTKGLDSNCVNGRQLTALILSSDSEEKVVQVQCQQHVH